MNPNTPIHEQLLNAINQAQKNIRSHVGQRVEDMRGAGADTPIGKAWNAPAPQTLSRPVENILNTEDPRLRVLLQLGAGTGGGGAGVVGS